jgi:membrane protease subunit (stomatin/prohibitin family)
MFNWLVGKIMERGMKKDTAFMNSMANYNREIAKLSQDIENTVQSILQKKKPKREWTCFNCGKDNIPATINVCSKCGSEFDDSAVRLRKVKKQIMKGSCPKCGKKAPSSSRYCSSCGTELMNR